MSTLLTSSWAKNPSIDVTSKIYAEAHLIYGSPRQDITSHYGRGLPSFPGVSTETANGCPDTLLCFTH